MVKKALIVGINAYPSAPLRGCVNDARDMEMMLRDNFEFDNMQMLLDEQATTANIKAGLQWLITGARPGDVLFFHYSGHGSQVRDTSDPDIEPDGLDEIICPVDLDWNTKIITDDYLKWVFDQVPAGVNLTVFFDCCNSGSALDQIEFYQPLGLGAARTTEDPVRGNSLSRYLPPPSHLRPLTEGMVPKTRSVQSRQVDSTGLLLTGCQSQQTSADAYINGRYNGAATYALVGAVRTSGFEISYKHLVEDMNNFMVKNGFSQRPELNGSSALYEDTFLAPARQSSSTPYVPPTTPSSPPPTTNQNHETVLQQLIDNDDNKTLYIILAVVGVVLAALVLL